MKWSYKISTKVHHTPYPADLSYSIDSSIDIHIKMAHIYVCM